MDGTCFGGALKRHRTKALVIIVKGTCHEDVVIDRNLVTLVAATPQVFDLEVTNRDDINPTTVGQLVIYANAPTNVTSIGLLTMF